MKIVKDSVDYYHFHCPGCGHGHTYTVKQDGSGWSFNGDMDKPTFTPSLKNTLYHQNGNKRVEKACHLFVTDGYIIFCDDCSHEFAGQRVEMKDLPNR
jgi:Family of unknown function (DUF6527)